MSLGFKVAENIIHVNDTDSIRLSAGTANFDLFDISDTVTIIDAQLSLATVGVYTQYLDIEFYVGSLGATLEWGNGKFTFGLSIGTWGFKITIRFW